MKFKFLLTRKAGKTLKAGNQILNSNDRLHPQVKAKIVAYLRDAACTKSFDADSAKVGFEKFDKLHPCEVTHTIYSPTRRRIDPTNFQPTTKALMDGLTDGQIWTDDNCEIVKSETFRYGGLSGGKYYVIEIEITAAPILF